MGAFICNPMKPTSIFLLFMYVELIIEIRYISSFIGPSNLAVIILCFNYAHCNMHEAVVSHSNYVCQMDHDNFGIVGFLTV